MSFFCLKRCTKNEITLDLKVLHSSLYSILTLSYFFLGYYYEWLCLPPPNPRAEVLIPSSSECDLILKCGYRCN